MNYKYKVLGVKLLDFHNDQGEHIHGYQVWCCAPTASTDWVNGVEVFKVWIKFESPLAAIAAGLKFGCDITGDCDRKGRPISIEVVPEKA